MSAENVAETSQRMLASRPGASRELLARKARQGGRHTSGLAPLEAIFPYLARCCRPAASVRASIPPLGEWSGPAGDFAVVLAEAQPNRSAP